MTATTPVTVRPRRRRRVVLVIALALVVLGVVAAWWYVPAIDGVRNARATAAALATDIAELGPGDVTPATVKDLRARVALLDAQLAPARDHLAGDPLVAIARGLGLTRDHLLAADAMVGAADALIQAAGLGLDVADRVAQTRAAGGATEGLLSALVDVMAESTDRVDRVATLLEDADARLAAMPAGAAPQLLEARTLVDGPLARYRPLLEQYRRIDDQLPAILGHDGERRYLILAQNPAELRPTGGYIGTYGLLALEDGAIASLEFHDIYDLDEQVGMAYQEPPEPLQDHLLGRTSWELADANWSPDFPTSAADALRLYTLESGDADIDGVIAITTYALDRLLEVLGPVTVPGTDVTVAPGEVTVAGIANTRGGEGEADRKRFLSELASEILRQVFALDPERWTDLLGAAQRIGDERLALAWFPAAADQAVVDGTRWSGRLAEDAGDFVAAVDANVTPSSKLSMVVERSSDLEVTLGEDDSAEHRLRLTWRNDADLPGEPYQTLRDASEGTGDEYGVFARVLMPADSEIVEIVGDSVFPVSGIEYEDEVAGRLAYGNYLLIEPGTAWLEDSWITPGVVTTDGEGFRYRLTVQKQPGQIAEPTTIVIHLPEGAVVTDLGEGLTGDGGDVRWTGDLVTDLALEVRYTR